jgi:uncharacterized phosphosugar-binding protein
MEGYSTEILRCYPVKQGDVMIIASNSGRNATTIEMAIEAREHRMNVIAITSLDHSRLVTSRHVSGKRLFELADVVIDNCGIYGDASIMFDGIGKICPTSTIMGCLAIHTLISTAAEMMINQGKKPEVFTSSNSDNGDNINEIYLKKYSKLIRSL